MGNALVALAAVNWARRVRLEAVVRHHYLLGISELAGWESILRLNLRGELRVWRCHSLGVRWTYSSRTGSFTEGGAADVTTNGTALWAYWSFVTGAVAKSDCEDTGKPDLLPSDALDGPQGMSAKQ